MKKRLLILLLFPFLSFGQVQIGQDIDGEAAGDQSGISVRISSDGNIVAIGAKFNNGNGNFSGHVRVYENQSGNWVQIGQDIDGEAADDRSGGNISLSSDGNIVAIGATGNDDNGNFSGHVRVYENQSGNWVQIGQDIDGESVDDRSGGNISLSSDGSTVAIGAVFNDGNGSNSGHVKVYENQSDNWVQIGQDIDGEAQLDQSGRDVSLSSDGSIVAIGAILNNNSVPDSGQVRVFENIGGNWVQIGQNIDGEAIADAFGFNTSLSSDGSIVAIGACGNDNGGFESGYVRVFENIGGVWTQIGQDINGEAEEDRSGDGLSISSDGSIVAIGARSNDGNGNLSGHVRIYQNQGGTWVQVGQDINGEGAIDGSGITINLSSDGSIVAIGAPFNDGNGENSGHVRIFDLSGVLSTEEITDLQFSIYPNPASTNVTIQLNQNSSLEKATMYNTLGQIVKTSTETIINISDVSKGMYILEITTDQGKASKKLIIE